MRRTLIAVVVMALWFATLAIGRTLHRIEHQLALISCLYQAQNDVVCAEAKSPKKPEPTPYV